MISMITRAEAIALRNTWNAQAGTRTCLHHCLFLERIIDPAHSMGNFFCMNCGADVLRQFTLSVPPRGGSRNQVSWRKANGNLTSAVNHAGIGNDVGTTRGLTALDSPQRPRT